MIKELIEQIGGRERLEYIVTYESRFTHETVVMARALLAVLDAQEKPRGWLTWHAIPPTWSDPGGGGEYLAFHEMKPSVHSDDGTDAWPVFDTPPAVSAAKCKSRKLFTCSGCGAEGLDEPLESKCHCCIDGAEWIEGKLYTAPPAKPGDN